MEEVKKISSWLKEFNQLKLQEKLSLIKALEHFQHNIKAIKLIINQRALITINVKHGNWTSDVVCLISLLLSNHVCSAVSFDLGWQEIHGLNHLCKFWIQCCIEHSVNMFQIFKLELLDGVELEV